MTRFVAISLMVTSDNPAHITRATHALTNVATGLALDGIEVELMTGPSAFDCDHEHTEADDT